MTTTELRPATLADAPRLSELVQHAYAHYVEPLGGRPRPMNDNYEDVVARHRVTVAEAGGAIVGLVVLTEEDGDLWIDNVAVDPAVRETGVGRALLEYADSVARSENRRELWLLTHELMSDNRALYERIGYVEDHRRPLPEHALIVFRKALVEDV